MIEVAEFVADGSVEFTSCFCCCSSFSFAFCFRFDNGCCASVVEVDDATDVALVEEDDEALREGCSEELEINRGMIDHTSLDDILC